MQLPRGTFREIKKAELISSLLNELETKKFSGICSISSRPVSGTLVFKSGTCILAKVQNNTGNEAWDELLHMSGGKADAALSNMDEIQIRLALEFNEQARVIKTGTAAPRPRQPPVATHEKHTGKTMKSPVAAPTLRSSSPFAAPPARTSPPPPAVTAKQPAESLTPLHSAQTPEAPVPTIPRIMVHHPEDTEKTAEPDGDVPDSSSFEMDIDTFESLDLDNMTDKIRNDCKTIIKQLELEHLMER